MKKIIGLFLFTIVIVALVAIVVFTNGNQQNSNNKMNNNLSGVSDASVSVFELTTHNTQEDCWVSYQGKVYDITLWLPKHPGSAEAITPFCGTTTEFEDAFTGRHGTSKVEKLMEEGTYKGELR